MPTFRFLTYLFKNLDVCFIRKIRIKNKAIISNILKKGF